MEFLPTFYDKFQPYLKQEENKKKAESEAAAKQELKIKEIGDQSKILKAYFEANNEFLSRIKERISNYSSKDWRNWVRLKVCSKIIANGEFSLLTLSAPEIKAIAFQFN